MKYGLALALSRDDQHDEALQLVEELYERNPQSVLYVGAYAELLINAERTEQANELLGRALSFYPDSYPLSMLYAQALIADQEYAGAERIYKQISRQRPHDPLVWFELAETSGLAGNVVDVHLARAEFFYLNGAPHRAIQHLEYAKNLSRRRQSAAARQTDPAHSKSAHGNPRDSGLAGLKGQHSIQRAFGPLAQFRIHMNLTLTAIFSIAQHAV